MSTMAPTTPSSALAGVRVAIWGRLAGMSKRDALQLVRNQGGALVEANDDDVQWLVVGDDLAATIDATTSSAFDESLQARIESGEIQTITESQFWQRLGLVDDQEEIRRLYTPAMLAELVGVSVAVVRRWHRRGLIRPVREVRRLPYFDFQEVAAARRLAELLASGMSPAAIERKLAELARVIPGVERPLAQLSVIVQGSRLLLRQGDGLIGPGGQLFFDFESQSPQTVEAADDEPKGTISLTTFLSSTSPPPMSSGDMLELAESLEEEGELEAAVEAYRAHAAAAGPTAPVCFAMAELLYRLGNTTAALERYYMAIELDENYVEARANLGCVLAELGQCDLAIAAFEGAISLHAEYADAHYHLACALDEAGRRDEAEEHWHAFLHLAPESPWAAAARTRLAVD